MKSLVFAGHNFRFPGISGRIYVNHRVEYIHFLKDIPDGFSDCGSHLNICDSLPHKKVERISEAVEYWYLVRLAHSADEYNLHGAKCLFTIPNVLSASRPSVNQDGENKPFFTHRLFHLEFHRQCKEMLTDTWPLDEIHI